VKFENEQDEFTLNLDNITHVGRCKNSGCCSAFYVSGGSLSIPPHVYDKISKIFVMKHTAQWVIDHDTLTSEKIT
jgi:hypothetical protein